MLEALPVEGGNTQNKTLCNTTEIKTRQRDLSSGSVCQILATDCKVFTNETKNNKDTSTYTNPRHDINALTNAREPAV